MSGVAAVGVCVILAGLAVLQVALVCGAPLGRFAWGGSHDVLPLGLRIGSAASVGLYAVMAIVVLTKADVARIVGHQGIVDVGTWVLVGYFALGVVVNGISRSRSERAVMTPVCAALAALTTVVALGL